MGTLSVNAAVAKKSIASIHGVWLNREVPAPAFSFLQLVGALLVLVRVQSMKLVHMVWNLLVRTARLRAKILTIC